jgi:hypothetical protein
VLDLHVPGLQKQQEAREVLYYSFLTLASPLPPRVLRENALVVDFKRMAPRRSTAVCPIPILELNPRPKRKWLLGRCYGHRRRGPICPFEDGCVDLGFRLNLDLSCIVVDTELVCERMMAWVSKEGS